VLQTVEDFTKDRARKGGVKVEDCAGGKMRLACILVDERNLVTQVQPLCASPGAVDVRGFGLDTNAARVGTSRGQQGNVAQTGAKIDQHIGGGERRHFEQREDVASRGGLIKHFFGVSRNACGSGFFELKYSGN